MTIFVTFDPSHNMFGYNLVFCELLGHYKINCVGINYESGPMENNDNGDGIHNCNHYNQASNAFNSRKPAWAL